MWPHYKYLPKGWDVFNDTKGLLCERVRGKVVVPEGLEWEYYWSEVVVGILNKKWIEMRGSDRTVLHSQFKSESIVHHDYRFFSISRLTAHLLKRIIQMSL